MHSINVTAHNSGESTYDTGEGATFTMPELSQRLENAEPVKQFHLALNYLDRLTSKTREITSDQNLSQTGKDTRLDPVRTEALQNIAAGAETLNRYEAQINAREAEMLALPKLPEQATVAAIEEREIRDYWRSQSLEERTKISRQMQDNPAAHERLMLAVLRSPIPVALDEGKELMTELWSAARRASNPELAASIADSRQALEWARRGYAHAAVIARRRTTWPGDKVRKALMSGNELAIKGASVFG